MDKLELLKASIQWRRKWLSAIYSRKVTSTLEWYRNDTEAQEVLDEIIDLEDSLYALGYDLEAVRS